MFLVEMPFFIALIALMALLHLFGIFFSGVVAKIFTYVNIALHICAIMPMMKYNLKIEEAVLVYMISVFVFTAFAYIKGKSEARFEKKVSELREKRRRLFETMKEEGRV